MLASGIKSPYSHSDVAYNDAKEAESSTHVYPNEPAYPTSVNVQPGLCTQQGEISKPEPTYPARTVCSTRRNIQRAFISNARDSTIAGYSGSLDVQARNPLLAVPITNGVRCSRASQAIHSHVALTWANKLLPTFTFLSSLIR